MTTYPQATDPVSALTYPTTVGASLTTRNFAHSFAHGQTMSPLGIYNVRHYGAYGTGGVDDSAAFAATVAAAKSEGALGKGSIYIPAGYYLVNNWALQNCDGMNIYGDGHINTVLVGTSVTPNDCVMYIENSRHMSLRNFSVQAAGRAGVQDALQIHGGCVGHSFFDMEFTNARVGINIDHTIGAGVNDQNENNQFFNCRVHETGTAVNINAGNSQQNAAHGGNYTGDNYCIYKTGAGGWTQFGGNLGAHLATVFYGFGKADSLYNCLTEGEKYTFANSSGFRASGCAFGPEPSAAATGGCVLSWSSDAAYFDDCIIYGALIGGNDSTLYDTNCTWGYEGKWTDNGTNARRISTDVNGTFTYYNTGTSITTADPTQAALWQTVSGELRSTGGVATKALAGVPADGSFSGSGVTAPDGMMALNTTNHRLHVRDGGTYRWAPLTSTAPQTYSATNVSTDRAYDANATTTDELADVLGTLIVDLRAAGVVA